ncbi:MAG: hypothetical protein JWO67_2188 [Streptosporangiaceae bacterium]|nr:hypothetical protein [Streptosporangiaceae bacterium]
MIVDRALRAFVSLGAGALAGLLRRGSQYLSDTLSGGRRQPDQPQTDSADVVRDETLPEGQQTIAFGLDGQTYEIDLDAEDAGELRSTIQRYINAGRRIGAAAPTTTGNARPRRSAATTQRNDTAAIRAWARDHGHPVSDRGRIPAAVMQAYEAARHARRRTG